MIKYLQQRYLLTVVFINCIQFCFGIQCEGECCYWYRRFPATPSVCYETNQTTTVTLVCEVEYRPPNNSYNIEVNWYRSRNEESAGIGGEILNDENKYLQHVRDLIQMNQTFIRQYMLGVLRFGSSDRGYYWCQMVVNNVPLPPSPYGHFNRAQCTALDAICHTNQPICAQNTSVRYMAFGQGNANSCSLEKISPTRTTVILQEVTITNFLTTPGIVTVTVSKFPTTDTAVVTMSIFPTTGVISAIVTGIILFTLTIIVLSSIICIKKHIKGQSKEHDLIIHHCAKSELEEYKEANDISNPHYAEVRIAATDHSHLPPLHEESTVANDLNQKSERGDSDLSKTEHGSNLSTQQYPHSEADEVAQINYNHYSDQIKSQESHRTHTEIDVSSEYAVVDKSKKTSRLQSSGSSATRADSAMETPQYDKLKQDRPAKDVVTSEGNNQMDNLQEKNLSPEYAELSTREKIAKVIKSPIEKALQEKDCRSDSHEYDKLASMAQASVNVTKGEPEKVEQHYYYTLENPEESGSNKEKTTITISAGEIENNMPQAHHLVIDDKPIVPNAVAKAEFANVKEMNASSLDSHQGEASDDKA